MDCKIADRPEVNASAETRARKPTFRTLQAGRGLAAVLVVLVHLSGAIFREVFHHRFWSGFSFGHAGVEYFFVISGFIIAYLHWEDAGTPDRLNSFLRKRFLRIYPIYWLVLLLLLPIYFRNPHFVPAYGSYLLTLLDDAALLPTSHPPDLGVAWTLKHEILFYAVFAAIIFNRRLGFLLATATVIGSICVLLMVSIRPEAFFSPEVLAHDNQSLPLQSVPMLFFSPMHLLFVYGAAIVWMLKRGSVPYPALLAVFGVALFFGTGAYECYFGGARHEVLRSQLYGLGSAIGMAAFVELERTRHIQVPQALCLLGDASYSLYLIHFTLLTGLARLAAAANRIVAIPDWVTFSVLLTATVAAGIVFHILVEKPLLRRLSQTRSS